MIKRFSLKGIVQKLSEKKGWYFVIKMIRNVYIFLIHNPRYNFNGNNTIKEIKKFLEKRFHRAWKWLSPRHLERIICDLVTSDHRNGEHVNDVLINVRRCLSPAYGREMTAGRSMHSNEQRFTVNSLEDKDYRESWVRKRCSRRSLNFVARPHVSHEELYSSLKGNSMLDIISVLKIATFNVA